MLLASSTLYMLSLLLPFVVLMPIHTGVLQTICLCWPCHSWDLPFNTSFCLRSYCFLSCSDCSCLRPILCLAAFLILPCPTICPAVVLFVIRAVSAAMVTFNCSLLPFALDFAFTFPVSLASFSFWMTSCFVSSSHWHCHPNS